MMHLCVVTLSYEVCMLHAAALLDASCVSTTGEVDGGCGGYCGGPRWS